MNNDPNPNDPTMPMYQNSHPPPPRQPPRLVQWYRAKMARKPMVTGCLTALIALVILLLCGTISGIAHGGLQSLQASPTPVVRLTPKLIATPVQTTTPKPTSTPEQTTTPAPTATPLPTATPAPICSGTQIEGACYNYDSVGGSLVYNPPSSFCDYFLCVSTFWTATNGYVVECGDGKHSHSGGVSGACSRNGGVVETLYQH